MLFDIDIICLNLQKSFLWLFFVKLKAFMTISSS